MSEPGPDRILITEQSLEARLEGVGDAPHWDDVDGKPSTFAPSAHSHAVGDVAGLDGALDAKADIGHTHTIGDTDGLQAALDGKSDIGHTHTIGDTDGLQAALDDRPTHTEVDTALDAKVQLVTEFPSSPTPGVLYLRAEED